MLGLLDLPVEVRLNIFEHLFSTGKVVVDGGNQSEKPAFLSNLTSIQSAHSRSGQVLRTCKAIYLEATPILYGTTQFVAFNQAFAGKLPYVFGHDSILAARVRHLTWQLSCDFMKHLYDEDVRIYKSDLINIKSIEFRCQAENWKGSLCGALVDDRAIVQGREEMLRYAKMLQDTMRASNDEKIFVIEDTAQSSRGKLVFRVQRMAPVLVPNEVLIEA